MNRKLRVSRAGAILFEAAVLETDARLLALFGWVAHAHLSRFPGDYRPLNGLLALRIEDVLHGDPVIQSAWRDAYSKLGEPPVVVELHGPFAAPGVHAACEFQGGSGGAGAWPGGGGGGGGNGGAAGGSGADGAIALLCYSKSWELKDVELFVIPGNGKWICPKDVAFVTVITIGGGGGGAGGKQDLKAATPATGDT
jgi:hypothetical protein